MRTEMAFFFFAMEFAPTECDIRMARGTAFHLSSVNS